MIEKLGELAGAAFASLAGLLEHAKAIRVPGLATVGGWLARGFGALWRSFWAVWGNPVAYPIIGAVAVLAWAGGWERGHKPVAQLRADKAALAHQVDAGATRLGQLSVRIAALEAEISGLKMPAPPTEPPKPKPAPKPKPKAKAFGKQI